MDIKTQEEKILSWLQRGKKITALDALNRFKCLRLSARIGACANKITRS